MSEQERSKAELLRELAELRRRFEKLELRAAGLGAEAVAPRPPQQAHLDNVYFRQLFENSPQGIVLLDGGDRVIDCNRAFEQIFGYERDETLGQPINSLIVPEQYAAEASELSEQALRGGAFATERVRRRKDGSPVEVQILGYPIFENGRQVGIFGIYSDISGRRLVEETIRLQGAAINSSANAIFITSSEGEIVWVNGAFTQLSGYEEAEALGQQPDFLDAGRADPGLDVKVWKGVTGGQMWRGRVVCRGREGLFYTVEQTVTPIENPQRQVTHYVVVQEDISARIDAEKRLHHLSRHDALTDLPNRYTLCEQLELELDRALRLGRRVAVMALDLDHFKDVNEAYGHAAGDELLIEVAERLKRQLPVGCTLSRTGGDEFAIVQTDFFQLFDTNSLARRLITCFEAPFEVAGHRIYMSASIGIAVCPPGEADPRQLLKRADLALYSAKEEGRADYRMHTSGMERDARRRVKLGQELYRALERKEFYLVYQPQVELPAGRIVGVEALLRWQHPERGCLLPEEFVHLAESSGQIVPIGEWVLRTATNQARGWDRNGWEELGVAVNVSAIQFRNPDFSDTVAELLDSSGLPPHRLELELTEGVLMRASPVVDRNFQRLERLGVRFALDDFGKGYSSLAYLRRLRLHKLKIDRSFVLGLESEPSQGVIVSAVTALGQELGLQVIAEGVETAEQVEILRAKGCTTVQGQHVCAPLRHEALQTVLVEGRSRLSEGRIA